MSVKQISRILFSFLQLTLLSASPSFADETGASKENFILGCAAPAIDVKAITDPIFGAYTNEGPFHSPASGYLRNGGVECALVSDVNLKIAAGYTFVNPSPINAMLDLMDCMYEADCYIPRGGISGDKKCMEQLCKCNQAMVREKISCTHSNDFDCEKIKKALENGGGAMLGGLYGNSNGHAVQVTSVDCNHNVGLYRDPNNPDKLTPFKVTDSGWIDAPGGSMNNRKVAVTYVVN